MSALMVARSLLVARILCQQPVPVDACRSQALALGHADVHQLVDSRMRVKDLSWASGGPIHNVDHQNILHSVAVHFE